MQVPSLRLVRRSETAAFTYFSAGYPLADWLGRTHPTSQVPR